MTFGDENTVRPWWNAMSPRWCALEMKRHLELPPTSLQLLAEALNLNNQRKEARDLLRSARGHYPTDFWNTFYLHGCLLEDEMTAVFEEVIGCLRVAVAMRPDVSMVHVQLGTALQAYHQLENAIAEFKYAVALDPKDARTHNRLGDALKANNQFDDAIAAYKRAIEIYSETEKAHYKLFEELRKGSACHCHPQNE